VLQALFAIAVVFGIFAAWVAVMHWARKWENLPPDCDMIGDTGKGCGHCASRDACAIAEDQPNQP
jgi:hypothetical protein